jgi:hypothetical protein
MVGVLEAEVLETSSAGAGKGVVGAKGLDDLSLVSRGEGGGGNGAHRRVYRRLSINEGGTGA